MRARIILPKLAVYTLLIWLLAGCAGQDSRPQKLALLAPFEGKYRDLGYNALYAIRLALTEFQSANVQLLSIDDGGESASARQGMVALNLDPDVAAIIALGSAATHPAVQQANDKPLILIGNWGHDHADDDSFYAADIARTTAHGADDLHIFELLSGLRLESSETNFISNGALADEEFSARFLESDRHAPAPNWLATLTYDLSRMTLLALDDGSDLRRLTYQGINGEIRFAAGHWQDAPIHRYRIDADELILVDD